MNSNEQPLSDPTRVNCQIGSSWSLYDSYLANESKTKSNYDDTLNLIFRFSTLSEFAMLWKYTNYSKPSSIFYDSVEQNQRYFKSCEDDKYEKSLDGIILFKNGIEPKWEHPQNHFGCHHECNLVDINSEETDQIWHNLVFALVGETFPFMQYINGVRFLDRVKKFKSIKIEVWISVGFKSIREESEEHMKHALIIDSIEAKLAEIINRTINFPQSSINRKEHYILNKVN